MFNTIQKFSYTYPLPTRKDKNNIGSQVSRPMNTVSSLALPEPKKTARYQKSLISYTVVEQNTLAFIRYKAKGATTCY